MKRWIVAAVLFAGWAFVPCIQAQDHSDPLNHIELGVFGEYFHLGQTSTNFAGLGGRIGFNASRYFQLEAEMGYDFNQVFTESFNGTSGGLSTSNSNLRLLHGMFGPKIQTKGPVRLFATAKGGAINFQFDPRSPSFASFTGSVDNLRSSNVSAVFYAGGGAEAYLGPIGLRLDAGDEMYFSNGTHHNLRITFGPSIRF